MNQNSYQNRSPFLSILTFKFSAGEAVGGWRSIKHHISKNSVKLNLSKFAEYKVLFSQKSTSQIFGRVLNTYLLFLRIP